MAIKRTIITPSSRALKDLPIEVQEWIRNVSQSMNGGIEGGDVVQDVAVKSEQLGTAVTTAQTAADTATAAAAAADVDAQAAAAEAAQAKADAAQALADANAAAASATAANTALDGATLVGTTLADIETRLTNGGL